MQRIFLLFFVISFTIVAASAQLQMPNIFSDDMVLQQSTTVKLWGTSAPKARVEVSSSWAKGRTKVEADKEGYWEIYLETPAADKVNHTLRVRSDGESLIFQRVVMGEVWLCSGQSNMVFHLARVWGHHIDEAERALILAPNDRIRIFKTPLEVAVSPADTLGGEWTNANSESLATCSSTAYFFARNMQEALDVPIGIVIAAWGGAKVNSFMSEEAIKGFGDLRSPGSVDSKTEGRSVQHITSAIYNGMISPIVGYGIRGMLWYQGESDRDIWESYGAKFGAMICDMREKWGYSFPVHIAEIAPYEYPNGASGALMREVQGRIAEELEESYVISLLDLGMKNEIHPPEKEIVGYRFARSVLGRSYGWESVGCELARPVDYTFSGSSVLISLSPNCFPDRREVVRGFEVAGADGVFHEAEGYMISPSHSLEVRSDVVDSIVSVRYQFHSWVEPSEVVYDSRGNPLPSFRSDSF